MFRKSEVANVVGMDEILLGLNEKVHEVLMDVRSATASQIGRTLARDHNRRFNDYDHKYLENQVAKRLSAMVREGIAEAVDGEGVRGNPFSFAVIDDLPDRQRKACVKGPYERNGTQVVSKPRTRITAVRREKESNPSDEQRTKYVNVAVSSVLMQIQTAEAMYGKDYAEEIRNRLLNELKAK